MFSPLLVLAQLVSTSQAAAIVVAVEDGGTSGTSAELAAQLNDDTYFDFTATVVSAEDIDTATELAAYDVVVLGDGGGDEVDWTETMAAALETWNNAGFGGVVSVGWIDYVSGPGATVLTSIDNVQPIDSDSFGYTFCTGSSSFSTLSSHEITDGLPSTLTAGADFIEGSPYASDATNGEVLGSCDSYNTIVAGEYGSGRNVYLGYLYMASNSYSNTDLRSGDWDRLLEQAVAWSADALDTDGDGVSNGSDNCPNAANPGQDDADGDGVGDACDLCEGDDATGDVDGDLYCADLDCDDAEESVYPAAVELCDGQLNDCDGVIGTDEIDGDLDGYAICALDSEGWDGEGTVTGGDDCDDTDPDVYPGATELPNDGIDQDCDGSDLCDVDGDRFASVDCDGGDDCDDSKAEVNPDAEEIWYDGIDQDCDGADDDQDGDGYNLDEDCDDEDAEIYPGAPGWDENCEDIGDTGLGNSDKGCSCSSLGSEGAPFAAGLFALAFGLLLRRRRD